MKRMSILLGVLGLLACAAPGRGVEDKLQTLIDKAKPGAVVSVPPGKHSGPLQITRAITLRGSDPEKCVIEFMGAEPTVSIRTTKGVVLENLTVRWGLSPTDARPDGPAAVYARDAGVILRRCRLEPMDRPKETPYALLAAGRTHAVVTECKSTGFAYALMFTEGANGAVKDCILTDAGHSVVTMHQNSRVEIKGNILARCDYHAVRNTGGTMDMTNNLVVANHRAGAYLGNKPAHGRIANNLFTGSQGEIWGYARSDVLIEGNVFYGSEGPGVSFRDSCRLRIRGNSFVKNAQGLTRYVKGPGAGRAGAESEGNHYFENGEDFSSFAGERNALTGDPRFAAAKEGDFSPKKGSALIDASGKRRAGLSDPQPIRKLWATWKAFETGE